MKALGDHLSRNHCNWTITKILHTVLCAFIKPWRRAEILKEILFHFVLSLVTQEFYFLNKMSHACRETAKVLQYILNLDICWWMQLSTHPHFPFIATLRLSKSTPQFNCASKAFMSGRFTNSFCWWLCETCILHSFTFNASFQWQALHTWQWKRTTFIYAITEFKWLMLTNKNDNRTLTEVMSVTAACWEL